MKKNVLMIFALLVCVVSKALGSPVDRVEALSKAKEFMQARGFEVSEDLRMVQSTTVLNHSSSTSVPAYYVFNNGNDKGFVIVSGDDRCYPILGYSDEGSFNQDDVPENLAHLLQSFSEQVAMLSVPKADNIQSDYSSDPVPAPAYIPKAVKAAISPMVTCKWGQNAPYNGSCPIYSTSTGEHCAVGCTAVGMAQFLYYYKNRNVKTLQDNIDGYTTSSGIKVQSIAKGTKIDWDNMLDSYVGNESDTQLKAVTDFLFYCGASIGTVYRQKSSSGTFAFIGPALTKLFNFYPGYRLAYRTSYATVDWDNMIYNEIANGRPVLYRGASKEGGHVFVVDGFDGDDYYHCNWGWMGNNNGYFHLSAVKPEEENSLVVKDTGWTLEQAAYLGLQPLNGLQLEDTTPVLSSRITAFNSATYSLTTRVYNYTNEENTYSYGYAVKDKNGNLTVVGNPYTNAVIDVLDSKYFTYKLNKDDLSAAGVRKGSYKLVPVSKVKGENFWRECVRVNGLVGTFISFDYNPSASTAISNVVMHPVVSLKATKIEAVGSCLTNVEQPVRIIIENTGEDDYCDRVFLLASKSAYTFGSYKDAVGLYLSPGEKVEVEMAFTPNSTGTWYLAASTNYTGATNIGYTTVKINSGSSVRNLGVGEITINNKGDMLGSNYYQVYGNSITGKVKIVNLDPDHIFSGTIGVVLRQQTSTSTSEFTAESHRHTLLLGPGETSDLDIDFYELNNNAYRYKVVFYYADVNQSLKNDPFSKFKLLPGVSYYDNDGKIVATAPSTPYNVPESALSVDFTGVTGSNGVTKVVPNANPNTVYILGPNDTTPSGLTGKNIVKNGTATKLTLNDGFSFATPVTFTAKDIEFAITPDKGVSSNGGWFTLALPFKAEKVMVGDKQIDWFHSSTDTGKNFWLKEFVGMTGNAVTFDFVDEMKANTPYIIAVPGSSYGSKWNLVGKKMVFSGKNQAIISGAKIMAASDVYMFAGTTTKTSMTDVWGLNSEGSRFNYGNYEVDPFRGYFRLRTGVANAPESLVIVGAGTDGIEMISETPADGMVSVYNLSGIKVAEVQMTGGRVELGNLPRGIYVINGQKFIK